MKQYRYDGRVLYLAEGKDAPVHFVPDVNWDDYLQHRCNTPSICRLFNTIEEAQQAAMLVK